MMHFFQSDVAELDLTFSIDEGNLDLLIKMLDKKKTVEIMIF